MSMTSLCRLSSGSQFCLSKRLPLVQAGRLADDPGSCATSQLDGWHRTPDSTQRRDLDSTGDQADAASRNTSFMLSLMDICSKMIQPLAALQQQDCESSAEPDTATVDAEAGAAQPPPPGAADAAAAGAPSSRCHRRCCGPSGHPAVWQTNQHQPTAWDCKQVVWLNNANSAGRRSQSSKKRQSVPPMRPEQMRPSVQLKPQLKPPPLLQPQPQPQPQQQQQPQSRSQLKRQLSSSLQPQPQPQPRLSHSQTPAAGTNDEDDGCRVEAPAKVVMERPPLLRDHGVPRWNRTEYHDFRAVAQDFPTQVFEPMFDPGLHRHMLIIDSHQRLKAAIAGFRAPVYRPY